MEVENDSDLTDCEEYQDVEYLDSDADSLNSNEFVLEKDAPEEINSLPLSSNINDVKVCSNTMIKGIQPKSAASSTVKCPIVVTSGNPKQNKPVDTKMSNRQQQPIRVTSSKVSRSMPLLDNDANDIYAQQEECIEEKYIPMEEVMEYYDEQQPEMTIISAEEPEEMNDMPVQEIDENVKPKVDTNKPKSMIIIDENGQIIIKNTSNATSENSQKPINSSKPSILENKPIQALNTVKNPPLHVKLCPVLPKIPKIDSVKEPMKIIKPGTSTSKNTKITSKNTNNTSKITNITSNNTNNTSKITNITSNNTKIIRKYANNTSKNTKNTSNNINNTSKITNITSNNTKITRTYANNASKNTCITSNNTNITSNIPINTSKNTNMAMNNAMVTNTDNHEIVSIVTPRYNTDCSTLPILDTCTFVNKKVLLEKPVGSTLPEVCSNTMSKGIQPKSAASSIAKVVTSGNAIQNKPVDTKMSNKYPLRNPIPPKSWIPRSKNNNGEAIKDLKKQISLYKKKIKLFDVYVKLQQNKLKASKSVTEHPELLKSLKSPAVRKLTMMSLRNAGLNNGRRFKESDMKFAVNLFKQDRAGYKFLRSIGYILPRYRTVSKIVADEVKNEPGQDPANAKNPVEILKQKVRLLKPSHRLCSVLFDEKLLLEKNMKTFDESQLQIADHCLVFMVKGIFKYFEQPVAYYYSHGPTNGTRLAEQLKKVITDLQSVGFQVMATICDHAENNRRAIDILINEARCDFLVTGEQYNDNIFVVNDAAIVAIYDPPHLLKSIRNQLISKDLSFVQNGVRKTAKWAHLKMMWQERPEYKWGKLVKKLTEDHVFPEESALTITKLAIQIFSQSVSGYMGYMAEKDILPAESQQTADLLLFFDQLFDSLNGYIKNVKNPLLGACKIDSPHHQKWDESIEILRTMKFIEEGVPVDSIDIDCWIWTIKSVKVLMKKLLKEYKLPVVWLRQFNQDAVEKLFRVKVNPSQPKEFSEGSLTAADVTKNFIKALSRVNKALNQITPEEIPDIPELD